jgi:hypothetical protein
VIGPNPISEDQFAGVSEIRHTALAPGRKIKYYFDVGYRYLNSDHPLTYNVKVGADGPHGRFELAYPINLGDLKGTLAADLGNIIDIVKAIKELNAATPRLDRCSNVYVKGMWEAHGTSGNGGWHAPPTSPPSTGCGMQLGRGTPRQCRSSPTNMAASRRGAELTRVIHVLTSELHRRVIGDRTQ